MRRVPQPAHKKQKGSLTYAPRGHLARLPHLGLFRLVLALASVCAAAAPDAGARNAEEDMPQRLAALAPRRTEAGKLPVLVWNSFSRGAIIRT